MPSSVAILYHPNRALALETATWLAGELRARGLQVVSGSGWDVDLLAEICCDRELLVTMGGDGTIIRVARQAAPFGVPLLGVNMGRVGFLAELTPDTLPDKVDMIARGEYWIEQRMMLDVEWRGPSTSHGSVSLNEVAVARGIAPRAIHVRTMLDGDHFITFTADGVLVATATGSTAYSLAAGGPILYPDSRDFMITPVAPHLHIGRSVIVPGDAVVTLALETRRPAVISVDGGEEHALGHEDTVTVCRSQLSASFARFGPHRYFYAALADRLR